MLRRNTMLGHSETKHQDGDVRKASETAASTDHSDSNHQSPPQHLLKPSIRHNKEKSQLCKKFTEHGSCPYERKCKFAHGSHELRKNQQFNSKYKTKLCGVFLNSGCCMFGNRCNFIHTPPIHNGALACLDVQLRGIKAKLRQHSRLLECLSFPSFFS